MAAGTLRPFFLAGDLMELAHELESPGPESHLL